MIKFIQVVALLSAGITSSAAHSYSFSDSSVSEPAATLSAQENTVESLDSADDDESLDSVDAGSGSAPSGSSSGVTISTIESVYTNWVGPSLGDASDTACYREAHIAKTCPLEFVIHHDICWAECPISYPVKCGMECIRQNDDCALEIVSKVSVIAQSALSLATFGLYGEFKLMVKGVRTAFKCGKEMMNLVKQLTKYVRGVKVANPHTTKKYLEMVLYQTDNVVFDLPITICTCLGLPVSESIRTTDRVTNTIALFVKEIVSDRGTIVASWASFTTFMKRITLNETMVSLDKADITSLQSALSSNSTCGYNMKRLLDRTWMSVAGLRKQDPAISEADIRVAMSQSSLVLSEIPMVTNNCMKELLEESDEHAAYSTRDLLRKSFGGIMDDLIRSSTSRNGTLLTAETYAYKIADKALTFYAVWDLTNIAGVVSEYFQTICGPTKFTGEIDDGKAEDALGLKAVGEAFKSSAGSWTKTGDGAVTVTFHSVDSEDVTVNVKSGGETLAKVKVAAGETVTWTSDMTALGGKTLYLDRWRPGFLGLPGTGGGSLLLWVPRSTQGGSLQLTAMLNES